MKLRSVLLERILAQDAFPGAGGMACTRFFRGLFASLQMIAASLLAAFFWLPWHVYSYLLGVCTGIAVAYAACLPGGRRMAWRDARPFLPLLLLYLLFLLGVLYSGDKADAWRTCGRNLSILLYPVIFMGMKPSFFTDRRLRWFAFCFVAGCLMECFVKAGIMADVFFSNPDLDRYHQRGWRVALNQFLSYQGPYMAGKELMHTTYEALLLNFAFALTGMAWIRGDAFFRSSGRRLAGWFALAVFALALLTSNSKTGQVLFGCTFLILCVQTLVHKQYRKAAGLLLVSLAIGGCALMVMGKGVTNRVRKSAESLRTLVGKEADGEAVFDDRSALPRLYCWKTAFSLIKESPWIGIGTDSRKVFSERFRQLYPDYPLSYKHPHNQFLAIWVSHGLAGLLLFLWFLCRSSIYLCRGRNVLWWVWGLGLLLVCMTDIFWNGVYGYVYPWGIYGVIAMKVRPAQGSA